MKRIILVDGNSLMYRAYFATAFTGNLMQNSKGLCTNAIFSFIKMMSSLTSQSYDGLLVAFDAGKKTFRHEMCDTYKDGRSPMPDEFRSQIPHIKEFLNLSNIASYQLALYEADDIIGTIAKESAEHDFHVDIYTSDKDLLQLVSNSVTVHLTKRGLTDLESFTPKYLFEKYELTENQMVDLKALMGDPSDNLKGVAGVGEKTAIKLLKEYGTLENIIAGASSIKGKLGEKILNGIDDALLCQKMCTIKCDSPIMINYQDTFRKEPNVEELNEFYRYLEFHSLLKKTTPKPLINNHQFKIVDDVAELKTILVSDSYLVFETLDYNYHNCDIIAIAMKNRLGNFILSLDFLTDSLDFRLFLEDDKNEKIVYDLKKSYVLLLKYNIKLSGVVFDTRIASYVVDPNIQNNSFKLICEAFDYTDIPYEEEVYGKGAKLKQPDDSILQEYLIKKINAIYEIKGKMLSLIVDHMQLDLFVNVEIPLAYVLGKMEFEGILVDLTELEKQSVSMKERIVGIENQIYELCGHEFNISSVKQLGEVLFEQLELPVIKKNKTGYSTDIAVLEALIDKHPVIKLIIEYRSLTKLYSTYLEGLKNQIYPDGKVHTIFEQTLTTTGRLSSIEPNLQNIPVKTEEGRQIRKLFIPSEDYVLLSSDYSQIELRVLAHMAEVEGLIEAFNNNADIHTKTAQEIFHKTDVSKEERQKAKAVNFGIVYGISAFGLSENLDITRMEAKEYIDAYLKLYPQIGEFMEQIVDYAKSTGYVVTLLNRRRYINELKSPNYQVREFGKRTAMNAPIQGSAADIIKLAMIKVDNALTLSKLRVKMLVTVHDEIVLECHREDVDQVRDIVIENMRNAFDLSVKLESDVNVGKNWMETK